VLWGSGGCGGDPENVGGASSRAAALEVLSHRLVPVPS
jgi:hypothetical protein